VKPLRPDALTPTLSHREREKNEPPSTGSGGKTSSLLWGEGERRILFHGGGGKTSLLSWGERKDEPL